jgi:hypothetical protein
MARTSMSEIKMLIFSLPIYTKKIFELSNKSQRLSNNSIGRGEDLLEKGAGQKQLSDEGGLF